MKKLPNVSDAEWTVMKVLWEKSPRSFAEIADDLKNKQSWSPKTIHTLVGRLVKKGAVSVQKEAPSFLYSAAVSEDALIGSETNSFVERVFDGSANALIAHFVKAKKFSDSELEELKNILKQKN
jgi:BlaI family transcriptional regulator, penicillinase repressor